MGMFMASVAFRCSDENVRTKIQNHVSGVAGLVSNLHQDHGSYAIVSPYGDQGDFLSQLAEPISRLTGDYAVMAICNDSDFNIMGLYHNGVRIERSCIGECYEEFYEFDTLDTPKLENWKPLLLDLSQEDALGDALFGEEIFAEVQLRKLTALTGLPIFDDELMMGG